ncbi:AAA family ATPase [Nonomuraea sp. LPB2021202275-12-8]|uniref:AAA family ATPase n=1 Tax=Nonomuraea sp. LPB2021202275-12-8 TaxID=3120159 RepID=UPI00300D7EC2
MTTTLREGLRAPGSGPTGPDAVTRKKTTFWERSRLLVGLALAYLVLTWKVMADFEGIVSYPEAMRVIAQQHRWILWLLGAEALRQAHFLIGERWPAYDRFWSRRVFGGFERWSRQRFDDWTRFRVSRVLKITFWIVLTALVLGAVLDTDPFLALLRTPALTFQALPPPLRLLFLLLVIAVLLAGLLWSLSRGGVETYLPDDIRTRFADVWGQDHVVERLREEIVLLERPGEIERRGGYVPGGLLMWGPPGTGKALMAEAVAGETGRPYVFVDPGAFMGFGILRVKALFRRLRRLALRYGGVIVFFDEADTLGRSAQQGPPGQGGGLSGCHGLNYLSEETRTVLAFRGRREAEEPGLRERFLMSGGGTLQALLGELSGLRKPRGFFNRQVRRLLGMRPKPPPRYRILVMMATNRPDALDEALLRPGRVDRIYKVGYPSKAGRLRTYQGYLDKVGHDLTGQQIDKLATITPYATGATIKDLVNESLITAIRDGRQVITWSDVLRAKRLKQLGPPEDVAYVERERHAVAVHEACHAVVAYATRCHLGIDIATIEKGADYLGMVASIKPEDRFTRWKSECEADIMVSLASLAGERMFFGEDNSSGVSGDLRAATFLTALMESSWGMGSGVTSLPALQELDIMPRRGPEPTPDVLAERIEVNLVRLLEKTERLLREHRRDVLCVAHALETHRTLDGDDVVAIIERSAGPLVDGTVYASDELYRELEDYHRDAARAHKEHGRIDRRLPGPATEEVARSAVIARGVAAPGANGPAPVRPVRPVRGHAASGPVVPGQPARAVGRPSHPGFAPWAGQAAPVPQPRPALDHVAAFTGAPPAGPVAAAGRTGRHLWLVAASAVALLLLAVFIGLAVTGALTGGPASGTAADTASTAPGPGVASPGLLLALFVVVVAVIVGGGLVAVAVKGIRAAHARTERERDQAHARAQLLAAVLDPDTAMRLLGYDGNGRRESS